MGAWDKFMSVMAYILVALVPTALVISLTALIVCCVKYLGGLL